MVHRESQRQGLFLFLALLRTGTYGVLSYYVWFGLIFMAIPRITHASSS